MRHAFIHEEVNEVLTIIVERLFDPGFGSVVKLGIHSDPGRLEGLDDLLLGEGAPLGEKPRDRLAGGLLGSPDLLAHAVLLAHANKGTDVSMLPVAVLGTSFAYGGRVTSAWAPLGEVIAPENGMGEFAEVLRAGVESGAP